jgi:predicted nucleic acid-binding protein
LKVYIDTSFLVSLYSLDGNSVAAARIMQKSKGEHLISSYGELEIINALQLRVFRKELSANQAQAALKNFDNDLGQAVFQPRALPELVFERARQLSLRRTAQLGTRTADLLHVVIALELNVDYLYTFDQQQRKLAQKLRLKVN